MREKITGKADKAEIIIETAQKRFALYGIEKTTMREIAGDLNMTKGSLYYYFPDKENLYKAVIEKEQTEFLRVLKKDLASMTSPSDGLRKYVINRLHYFKTLVNLSRLRAEAFTEYKPYIAVLLKEFKGKEKSMVEDLLEKGRLSGEFRIEDSQEAAFLFLDILRGLRSAVLSNKKLLVIDDEEYKILSKKVIAFTDIFLKGIANN